MKTRTFTEADVRRVWLEPDGVQLEENVPYSFQDAPESVPRVLYFRYEPGEDNMPEEVKKHVVGVETTPGAFEYPHAHAARIDDDGFVVDDWTGERLTCEIPENTHDMSQIIRRATFRAQIVAAREQVRALANAKQITAKDERALVDVCNTKEVEITGLDDQDAPEIKAAIESGDIRFDDGEPELLNPKQKRKKTAAPPIERNGEPDKTAKWEAALQCISKNLKIAEFLEEEAKAAAKQAKGLQKELREKLNRILDGGSENYRDETPLFKGLEPDGADGYGNTAGETAREIIARNELTEQRLAEIAARV